MKIKTTVASSTFCNLARQKQQAIVKEMVREFAAQGYKKASINTIVKNLGIAKGSLYQYFKNKETMFYFVFEQFIRLVKDSIKQGVSLDDKADFFVQVRKVMETALNFVDRYPDYFQIYLQILFEHDVPRRRELLAQVRLFSRDYFGPLCLAAREQGRIRDDVSPAMLIFVLDGIIDRLLQDYVRPLVDSSLELQKMGLKERTGGIDEIIQILRDGFRG